MMGSKKKVGNAPGGSNMQGRQSRVDYYVDNAQTGNKPKKKKPKK